MNEYTIVLLLGAVSAALACFAWVRSRNNETNSAPKESVLSALPASDKIMEGVRNNSQLLFFTVVGAVLVFVLFDEIDAFLTWVGISWTTLFLIVGVGVLFLGASRFKDSGNELVAGTLYLVAGLVSLGLVYPLFVSGKVPFTAAATAAEVPTGEDWDHVSFEPGTEFKFKARRSVVFNASVVGVAYKCSTVDSGEHYDWEYNGPNLVFTPKDSMFAGGEYEVEAFTIPIVTANRFQDPALWQAQVDAQEAFIIEKRRELGCPGY